MSIRIAIDFSTLDTGALQNGLFRYVVDLVRGLDAIAGKELQFVVIGSKSEPVAEIAEVLAASPGRWTYERLARASVRGSYWVDHVSYWPILKRHRVHLLHAPHGFTPALSSCRIVCTIPDLMTEMFPEYKSIAESRQHRISRWLATRRAARLIAISQTTAHDIERRWQVPRAQIDVVPLGLSESFSVCAPEVVDVARRAQQEGGTILSPYNLEPRKNLIGLVEALALVRRVLPVRLALYGRAAWSAEREAGFKTEVCRLGLEDAIDLLGVIDDRSLAEHYRTCDLFVFPSLYEGFGYPVLEAMALGACVVARNASAMAEVLGDAGVLVETKDPRTLAHAIESLLRDRQRRIDLAHDARRRAALFSIERMARGTVHSYLSALGREAPIGAER